MRATQDNCSSYDGNLCIPLLFQKMYRRYYYSAAHSLAEFKLSLRADSAVKSLPAKSGDVLTTFKKGAPVMCVGAADGWLKVRTESAVGYIEQRDVRVIEPVLCSFKGRVKEVTELFEMPTKYSDSKATLDRGEHVEVVAKSGRWRYVKTRQGQEGWVRSEAVARGGAIRQIARAIKRRSSK